MLNRDGNLVFLGGLSYLSIRNYHKTTVINVTLRVQIFLADEVFAQNSFMGE